MCRNIQMFKSQLQEYAQTAHKQLGKIARCISLCLHFGAFVYLSLCASLSVFLVRARTSIRSHGSLPFLNRFTVLRWRSGATSEVSGTSVGESLLLPLRTSSLSFRLPALPPPPFFSLGLTRALGPAAGVS